VVALVGRRGIVGLIELWPKTQRSSTAVVVSEGSA
jgi:hypothetical protein